MPREFLTWRGAKDQVGDFLDRISRALRQPEPVRTLLYSASLTPDCQALTVAHLIVTVTNGTAFTVNAPINAEDGCELWLEIFNNSGGAMGAVTWNAAYVFDTAWTNPANGVHRVVGFYRRGGSWYQLANSLDTGGGGAEVVDEATELIAGRVYGQHPVPIPDVRAGANVTVTRDAQGYVVAASAGAEVVDEATELIAGLVYAPHPAPIPDVRASAAPVAVTRDAQGYVVAVPAADSQLILAGQIFGS